MKSHRDLTYALIWFLASAVSFYQCVEYSSSAALTRCGLFMLMGVVYLHSFRKK